jgi:DNA repair protein RecO (recombination protein O)
MEHWTDQGIVLSVRPHGEGGAVVALLTEHHGRHSGYVRGGLGSRMRGTLEPGNLVNASWNARIADSLGAFILEAARPIAAALFDDPLRLAALLSACSLCQETLPEREGHSGLFHGLLALLDIMARLDFGADEPGAGLEWVAAYVMWEIALLRELGFGIDLQRCGATGATENLAYVSPRTGRAVTLEAGEPYKEKLLKLPAFLRPGGGGAGPEELAKGLALTGYFLIHWVFAHHSRGVPEERLRFEERFAKYTGQSLTTSTSPDNSADGPQQDTAHTADG